MKKAVMALLVVLVLLVSCASEEFTSEDASFREECLTNGDGWMKMSETIDGQITGPSCYGCMPNAKNHFCYFSDYESYRSTGENIEGAGEYSDEGSSTA